MVDPRGFAIASFAGLLLVLAMMFSVTNGVIWLDEYLKTSHAAEHQHDMDEVTFSARSVTSGQAKVVGKLLLYDF